MIKLFSKIFLGLTFTALFTTSSNSYAASDGDVEDKLYPVDILKNQKIRMRDGTLLSANVYQPRLNGSKSKAPVVVYMTPYIKAHIDDRAWYLAKRGFNFVAVDVRGRGDSEGVFRPMIQEAQDGHDIVEWAAQQNWSNGRIGMLGGSYVGYTQWATIKEFPPHLETILPIASVGPGLDFPMKKNITYPYVLQWLSYVEGKASSRKNFQNSEYWSQINHELYDGRLSFNSLPSIAKSSLTTFAEWQKHPTFDEYWRAHHPTTDDYRKINIPILTISGYFDSDYIGAMNFYKQHMINGTDKAKDKHYLILGPWDHGGTRRPKQEISGIDFGAESLVDMPKLYVDWFKWTLADGEKPAFLKKRVAQYSVGENRWLYEDTFKPMGDSQNKFYFSSSRAGAGSVFQSGILAPNMRNDGVDLDSYTYDPLVVHPKDDSDKQAQWLTDQSSALTINQDGLVYHSEPFEAPITLAGEITASLWLSMNVKDTDMVASLYEIRSDGSSVFLAYSSMRARYRNSLEKPELVTLGTINQYKFDGFFYNVRELSKGSRLRFTLTAINSHQFQKNYNSGGVVSEESSEDAVTAEISLHHSGKYQSFITLPVFEQ